MKRDTDDGGGIRSGPGLLVGGTTTGGRRPERKERESEMCLQSNFQVHTVILVHERTNVEEVPKGNESPIFGLRNSAG